MLHQVVDVQAVAHGRLFLRFADGLEGTVDLREQIAFDGVFSPLNDPLHFHQVRINPDFGVVEWPNGADLDSDVLHSCIAGASPQPAGRGR